MSNFHVIRHTPTVNETGVYRNEVIHIYFNKPIEPNTVTRTTVASPILVYNNSTLTTALGSLGIEHTSTGTVVEATFTPEGNLSPNTEHTVYVSKRPSIIAADGEELNEDYSWSFTTGLEEYDEDAGSGTVPSGDLPASGTEIDLSGITEAVESGITSFYVYTTSPLNQEPNIAIDTTGIYVTFTGNISTSLADISGYVSVEETTVI